MKPFRIFLAHYVVQASVAPNLQYRTSVCCMKLRPSSRQKPFLNFQSLSLQRQLLSARGGGQAREAVSRVAKQMTGEWGEGAWREIRLPVQTCSL